MAARHGGKPWRMPAGSRQIILLCAALGLCPIAALLIGSDPAGPATAIVTWARS